MELKIIFALGRNRGRQCWASCSQEALRATFLTETLKFCNCEKEWFPYFKDSSSNRHSEGC